MGIITAPPQGAGRYFTLWRGPAAVHFMDKAGAFQTLCRLDINATLFSYYKYFAVF